MTIVQTKKEKRVRRQARIRAKISGTEARPRLSVFRSNKEVYAQMIDDTKGITVAAASSKGMKGKMTEKTEKVGKAIALAGKEKKITTVVFDRGGFSYGGLVKRLADSARAEGLVF